MWVRIWALGVEAMCVPWISPYVLPQFHTKSGFGLGVRLDQRALPRYWQWARFKKRKYNGLHKSELYPCIRIDVSMFRRGFVFNDFAPPPLAHRFQAQTATRCPQDGGSLWERTAFYDGPKVFPYLMLTNPSIGLKTQRKHFYIN